MLLCFGLAPQMMMNFASADSAKSTLAIRPYSASAAPGDLREPPRDRRDHRVPGDALEVPGPLRTGAAQRVQEAIRPVHAAREVAHLGADEPVGERVDAAAGDRHGAAVLDLHLE